MQRKVNSDVCPSSKRKAENRINMRTYLFVKRRRHKCIFRNVRNLCTPHNKEKNLFKAFERFFSSRVRRLPVLKCICRATPRSSVFEDCELGTDAVGSSIVLQRLRIIGRPLGED